MSDDYTRSTDPTDLENDPRDVNRLPPLGEATNPDNYGSVNNFLNLLAQKAVNFYTGPCDRADTNLTVLETGKATAVHEKDVIANKIRQDMLTMMASLLRDAVTRKITPEETGEPPELVPFLDPMTMSFQQFPIDDQVEAEFEQRAVDWYWETAELDADVWMALFNARTAGWYTAPYEWDWSKGLPRLRTNISVRQTPMDPAAGPIKAVETANWAFLRWRVNWWQARALFPHIAMDMAQKANDGTEVSDAILQLGKNEQSLSTGEKMVDLTFFWHRNYPVQPMTPEEALDAGEIEARPLHMGIGSVGPYDSTLAVQGVDAGQPQPDGSTPPPAPPEGSEGDAQAVPMADQAGADGGAATGFGLSDAIAGAPAAQIQPRIGFFLPHGTKPITPADPEWPWWIGIRQIARVQQCIAQDVICPYFDIPLLHLPANPLPMSACGQGDPEAMQKIQEGHNRALTNAVEHSDLFAHPIKVFPKSAWDTLPAEYKTKGASVAGMSVIISDDLYERLGGKLQVTEPAEPISAALGAILEILGAERQDITPAPNVTQGKQTGDITGWQSTQMLLQQATSKFDLPAMFLQMMVRRLMKFVRHSVLWFVPIEKLQQICSEYPPEVVEALVQRGRYKDRNVEVIVNLSSGGQQDRKIAEAVQKFQIADPATGERVIGMETLRDRMGEDNQKERDRQAGVMMAVSAQQQAEQAATMAKSQPKPGAGGKESSNGNGNGHAAPAGGRMSAFGG